MFKKILPISLLATMLLNFYLASFALAQTDALNILKEAGNTAVGSVEARKMEGPGWFGSTAGLVINVFLSLLGIIFLVLILYGGFLWMTAAGNEERIKKATQVISRAVIGLIIVAMSYGIAYFVLRAVTNATTGV